LLDVFDGIDLEGDPFANTESREPDVIPPRNDEGGLRGRCGERDEGLGPVVTNADADVDRAVDVLAGIRDGVTARANELLVGASTLLLNAPGDFDDPDVAKPSDVPGRTDSSLAGDVRSSLKLDDIFRIADAADFVLVEGASPAVLVLLLGTGGGIGPVVDMVLARDVFRSLRSGLRR